MTAAERSALARVLRTLGIDAPPETVTAERLRADQICADAAQQYRIDGWDRIADEVARAGRRILGDDR